MTSLELAPAWRGFPGASVEALEQLRQQLPPRIPAGYFDLLAMTDGGEGPLPVQPYNCYLDDVTTMLAGCSEAWRRDWLEQGFFIIGGDGGGEFLAFHLRASEALPLVAIDMVVGAESAKEVARTCEAFGAMLGHEPEE